MDSVENVRAFLAVAEMGSFTAAARRLDVSAPVVTKRVSALEKELHVLLFQRTTRSLTLTASGRDMLGSARDFLAAYERLSERAAVDDRSLGGRLRVKAPASFTNHFLGKLLNEFFLTHPKASLELQLANRAVDPVLENFDFVITGLPVTYDGVEEFPLCPFKRLVYASPGYLALHGTPGHPSDLPGHRCLLYSYQSTVRTWTFTDARAGDIQVSVDGGFATNDIDAMHNACVDGMGVAILPRYRANDSVHAGRLVQLLPGFGLPDYWIKVLRPANHHNPKLFHALLDYLVAGLARLEEQGTYL
ncbi:LysR family transcriptional regulator [Pandoraea sp. PE-S2R-1]|uniref:LysR family transcriptional regulator n=1 Tax=Pandoraea sp. PE-S2R-1 TaxID=1986994 RepID=UPI000B3FBC35|nr:LysR family transcriptional regulator [Pandoraea sp. PE-S2R-1]